MKIGIFAASSQLKQEARTYDFLTRNGMEVYEHPVCIKNIDGYLAGSATDRVDALHELFVDSSVDIIMSFWGGLNTNQILPKLNYDLIYSNYKPIIGYSDTTALLLAIWEKTKKITYLGPSGITFLKPEPLQYTYDYFQRTVIKKESLIKIVDSPIYADDEYFMRPSPHNKYRIHKKNNGRAIYREGYAQGRIIAGNLQTIAVLAGTEFFPDLSGSILFLEEAETAGISEVRRFMTQLSQQPNFSYVAGIVFGLFCEKSNINHEAFLHILDDIFGKMEIPIFYNVNFGHTDPMFTIPIGGTAILDTNKNIINILQ